MTSFKRKVLRVATQKLPLKNLFLGAPRWFSQLGVPQEEFLMILTSVKGREERKGKEVCFNLDSTSSDMEPKPLSKVEVWGHI